MAGGTFNSNVPKKRPGVYVNVKSGRNAAPVSSKTGTVALPLAGYDWGPQGKFLRIESTAPDAYRSILGRSINDNNKYMRMIKMAFIKAATVCAYIPAGGKKAKATATIGAGQLTIEAMYAGSLGNSLKVVSVANTAGGFDVTVYNGTTAVEIFEKVATAEELVGVSEYVTFTGTGAMAAFASVSLTGGENTENTNEGFTDFLDACEYLRFDCVAFPVSSEEEDLQAALLSKIRYIRENLGRKCQAVAANFEADYEGIINLTNGVVYDDAEVPAEEATAFVAGITAGADYVTSNTYAAFPGATEIVGLKSNEGSEAAIDNGEMFFTYDEEGNVVIEYDINSLVTFTNEKTEDYRKNRVLRVYDSIANQLKSTFAPNKFSNSEDGWAVMESLGRALLKEYEAAGAIMDVVPEDDFVVDRSRSGGEATYFDVAIRAIDSAEKLYFTVTTM